MRLPGRPSQLSSLIIAPLALNHKRYPQEHATLCALALKSADFFGETIILKRRFGGLAR